jgi:hypothetical protein
LGAAGPKWMENWPNPRIRCRQNSNCAPVWGPTRMHCHTKTPEPFRLRVSPHGLDSRLGADDIVQMMADRFVANPTKLSFINDFNVRPRGPVEA